MTNYSKGKQKLCVFSVIKKNWQPFSFIIINVIVAFVGFFRSFVYMEYLSFEGLGMITLLQTSAVAVGFLQMGLINGGYRVVAVNSNNLLARDIINTIFSYVASVMLIGFFLSYLFFSSNSLNGNEYLLFAIVLAFFTLLYSWLSNYLIAKREYSFLNGVNLTSAVLSVAFLPLAYFYGFIGASVILLIQPLAFVFIVLSFKKYTRPTKFEIKFSVIKKVLRFGFVPFLSSLFFLLYMQVERRSISWLLGTESLGYAYLFFMLVSLWNLVPVSTMNIFFPRTAKCFHDKQYGNMFKLIKFHVLAVGVYCVTASLVIYFTLPYFIEHLFPNHFPYINLVFLALPGLIFRSMSDPLSMFFNSVLKLSPIFWSDLVSLLLYLAFIVVVAYNNMFSLEMSVYGFNFYFMCRFIVLLISYIYTRNNDFTWLAIFSNNNMQK